ncbi:MAG: hypothetical protein FWG43_06330 [Clostridiales bacterium]|nr:hypothetical protein [Clostridiales bacterium]
MKTLNDYMNDPSVVNEQMPLREVHAIRLMLYDRTKDMTPSERTAYYNQRGAEAAKKYGLKVVQSVKRT